MIVLANIMPQIQASLKTLLFDFAKQPIYSAAIQKKTFFTVLEMKVLTLWNDDGCGIGPPKGAFLEFHCHCSAMRTGSLAPKPSIVSISCVDSLKVYGSALLLICIGFLDPTIGSTLCCMHHLINIRDGVV